MNPQHTSSHKDPPNHATGGKFTRLANLFAIANDPSEGKFTKLAKQYALANDELSPGESAEVLEHPNPEIMSELGWVSSTLSSSLVYTHQELLKMRTLPGSLVPLEVLSRSILQLTLIGAQVPEEIALKPMLASPFTRKRQAFQGAQAQSEAALSEASEGFH